MIYGAGHVGRALIRVLEGLPFAVTWADIDAGRFPKTAPTQAARRIAADPAALAAEAPPRAIHIVMTHSHPLDLAICHAVLVRGDFRFLGLIGSQTKRTRFLKRLRELGVPQDRLARLICPIGLPGVKGKQPAVIAVAVAAQLLEIAEVD
jgi:xanthine dehydrogenase accessory factor